MDHLWGGSGPATERMWKLRKEGDTLHLAG